MSSVDPEILKKQFQQMVETIDILRSMTEPMTSSIKWLLEVSASRLDSEEASVLIRDGDNGDLRFLSATGKVADQLMEVRIPAGKGIAGFVFSSDQPMAVTDVDDEHSFYAEVDRRTGYSTHTILATPLRFADEIIGVLEYVNRRGSPPYRPFTAEEMDIAAIYADAIASLVNAFESAKLQGDLGNDVLSRDREVGFDEVRQWISGMRNTVESRERTELAVLVREIALRGNLERKLCRELLESVIRFSNEKNENLYLKY